MLLDSYAGLFCKAAKVDLWAVNFKIACSRSTDRHPPTPRR